MPPADDQAAGLRCSCAAVLDGETLIGALKAFDPALSLYLAECPMYRQARPATR